MTYTLNNEVSVTPINCNIGYNNSWLHVQSTVPREFFAQASYITNFEDFVVTLSAGNVDIGAVELKDWNSNVRADVASANGYNALRVLTQDLESSEDDVSIGDRQGNFVSVNPNTSSLNVHITNNSTPFSFGDTPNLDAFGRLRVSQPTTIFDSKSLYDKGRFFWNFRQQNADEIFLVNDSSREARILNQNGYFVKETYRRFPYQPGKSQLLLFTGILNAENDVLKRVGLFTSLSGNNYTDKTEGIYFQSYKTNILTDKQSYAWVINNNTNLVPSQSATQENWNLDKMDGTGPSGITLDFSKSQIFIIDFEWLGVGRVRCGFNINGITYYCHQFLNANNINGTYITNPNLPIRAEIRSMGAFSGSMKTICASIMSEGGEDNPSFVTRSISLSAALNPAISNRRGMLGVRLNPQRTNGAVEIVDIKIFPQINQQNTFSPFKWELVMRPSPAIGRIWNDISNNSNVQYAYGDIDLQITGGEIVASGFGSRETVISLDLPIYEKCLKLGKDLDGIPDELWIVMTPIVDNQPTWCSITVAESD
jgi:hypothetical protein